MKHVRAYNLKVSGSRYVGPLAAIIVFMHGNCQTEIAAMTPQESIVETVKKDVPDNETIASWISELTSDDFGTRESARARLLDTGSAVIPELEKHLEATNSELRLSVSRLHESILDEIAANQIQSFLDRKSALAGWEIFRRHFGDTPENRHLYAKVFRTEQDLLELLDSNGTATVDLLVRLIRSQRSELVHSSQPNFRQLPILAAVVSALFGTAEEPEKTTHHHVSLQVQISLAQLVSEPGFHVWTGNHPPESDLIWRSLVDWVTARTDGPILMSSKINVARLLELRESIPLCLQCLESRDVPAANRRMAMELIVQFGDQSHFAALEKQIDDPLIVYRETRSPLDVGDSQVNTCQMGDIALASLILIAGQDLLRFGFANAGEKTGKKLPSPESLVFPDEETRQNARQRWHSYRDAILE